MFFLPIKCWPYIVSDVYPTAAGKGGCGLQFLVLEPLVQKSRGLVWVGSTSTSVQLIKPDLLHISIHTTMGPHLHIELVYWKHRA